MPITTDEGFTRAILSNAKGSPTPKIRQRISMTSNIKLTKKASPPIVLSFDRSSWEKFNYIRPKCLNQQTPEHTDGDQNIQQSPVNRKVPKG